MGDYVTMLVCSLILIVLCVGVISGWVSMCCWCHKCCRKYCRKRRRPQDGVNVIYVPAPTAPPGEYQLPNYYPAAMSSPNGSLSIPSAPPPSYQEATSSGLGQDLPQGARSYLSHPPDQSFLQPYNPDYCLPQYDFN